MSPWRSFPKFGDHGRGHGGGNGDGDIGCLLGLAAEQAVLWQASASVKPLHAP